MMMARKVCRVLQREGERKNRVCDDVSRAPRLPHTQDKQREWRDKKILSNQPLPPAPNHKKVRVTCEHEM